MVVRPARVAERSGRPGEVLNSWASQSSRVLAHFNSRTVSKTALLTRSHTKPGLYYLEKPQPSVSYISFFFFQKVLLNNLAFIVLVYSELGPLHSM